MSRSRNQALMVAAAALGVIVFGVFLTQQADEPQQLAVNTEPATTTSVVERPIIAASTTLAKANVPPSTSTTITPSTTTTPPTVTAAPSPTKPPTTKPPATQPPPTQPPASPFPANSPITVSGTRFEYIYGDRIEYIRYVYLWNNPISWEEACSTIGQAVAASGAQTQAFCGGDMIQYQGRLDGFILTVFAADLQRVTVSLSTM